MYTKRKLVHGVGINDADYAVSSATNGNKEICPYYLVWSHMIGRCYSPITQEKQPTYKGCSVAEEWLLFSNFRKWMEKQDYEGKQIDKDILIEGNKIYSPEACVFVDGATNALLTDSGNIRGKYPQGVNFHKASGNFRIQCCDGEGGRKEKSGYSDPIKAHHAYLKLKIEVVEKCADRQPDDRVSEGLLKRILRMKQAILDGNEYAQCTRG